LTGWRFALNLPETPVLARVDEVYLREALHTLLQNAMDATPTGKSIAVTLAVTAGQAELSVTDEGAGMDSSTLAAARLPYFTTKEKGTGLGLAIVEKFVNEMGGQVSIRSIPGSGTTVTISLKAESGT
jgi:two-component system sporulation sensor kinase B